MKVDEKENLWTNCVADHDTSLDFLHQTHHKNKSADLVQELNAHTHIHYSQ